MVAGLLCVAQFVVVLDATIVAIALPAVQADLGLSTSALGWVITAYTLTFGGCLLAAGRLADRIGRRKAFRAGLALFGAASLACGLAPSGAVLIGARAVQGLGAAVVSPAALALLLTARRDRRAVGWWTAAAAGGGASGWVLGGVLTGALDWRWVFLVNLPVCAAALVLTPRVLTERREPSPAPVDLAGALLATLGLGALVLGLTLAPSHALAALLALAAAGAVLALFMRVESRAADPVLSRRMRPALQPNAVGAVLTAATTPPMFFCVLHAQNELRLEPAEAGLLFPPFNLAVIAGSLAGPRVTAAVGERRAMGGGLLAVAAGALVLATLTLPSLLIGFTVMGAGLGVASVASTARGTAALAAADRGLASGLLSTSAQVGTVLGLAALVPVAEVGGYEPGFVLAAALAALAAATVGRAARSRASASCSGSAAPSTTSSGASGGS